MKIQAQKARNHESKAKAQRAIKSSSQNTHPILQMQQIIGNKATTNLLQRQVKKPNKVGQMIDGDLVVRGDARVYGTVSAFDHDKLHP